MNQTLNDTLQKVQLTYNLLEDLKQYTTIDSAWTELEYEGMLGSVASGNMRRRSKVLERAALRGDGEVQRQDQGRGP